MYPLVVLALAPKDEDALLCKIVANVQLAQYDAALSLIAKHGQILGDKVMFEKVHNSVSAGPSDNRCMRMGSGDLMVSG